MFRNTGHILKACKKSTTVPISANDQTEHHENSRLANLRLEKIYQHYQTLEFQEESI